MNKKTKIIAFISALCILFTGTLIVLANQENEFDIPHEHEYLITDFDSNTGVITFTCEICNDEKTDKFVDHINERGYEPIDMNHDGIVNGKDFAYLMRNYSNNN